MLLSLTFLQPFISGWVVAQELEDFSAGEGWTLVAGGWLGEKNEKDAPVLSYVKNDGEGAVRLGWRAGMYKYLELHTRKALPLQELEDKLAGALGIELFSDTPQAVRMVSLRLIDGSGEVFQAMRVVQLAPGEWQPVVWELEGLDFTGHWGGNNDSKVDLPVRVLGFSVDLNPEYRGEGSLLMRRVRFAHNTDLVERSAPLWGFDKGESWRLHPANAGATLQAGEDNISVTLSSAKENAVYSLVVRQMQHYDFARPQRATLRLRLEGDAAVGVNVRMRDAQNEIFQFSEQRLQPGENELVFDLREAVSSWGDRKNGTVDGKPKFHELIMVRYPGENPAKVEFRGATIVELVPQLATVDMELDTGSPVRIVEKGQKDIRLILRNLAREEMEIAAEVRLTDFFNRSQRHEFAIVLPAGGEQALTLPVPQELGIWYVNCLLRMDGAELALPRRSFVHMQPAGDNLGESAPEMILGIATHSFRCSPGEHRKEVIAAANCGARIIRTDTTWPLVEKEQGRWEWQRLDGVIEDYAKHGIEIQALLFETPRWAVADPERANQGWDVFSRSAPQLEQWKGYVRALAQRYNGRIRFWEVWNEPDIGFWKGTVEEYIGIQRAAYEVLKEVNPENIVMSGGFASSERNPEFVKKAVQTNWDTIDMLAWHRHGTFEPFKRELDGFLTELRNYRSPAKPVFFNETAMYSPGGEEKTQAYALFHKIIYAWAWGAKGYIWYDLRNDGFQADYHEHQYGLITHDFYPKAAYPAFNTLALHLEGRKYLGRLELGGAIHAYVFGDGKSVLVAHWDEPNSGQARHLLLKTKAKEAEVIDMMGNRTPQAVENGQTLLLSGEPGFLLLSGETALPVVGEQLLHLRQGEAAIAGRRFTLSSDLYNPLPQPVEVALSYDLAEAGVSARIGQTLMVDGGKRQSIGLDWGLPAGLGAQGVRYIPVSYEFVGTGLRGQINFPLRQAALAGGIDIERDNPVFVLDSPAQSVSAFNHDPNKAHLVWQGAQDCSARLWLGGEGKQLVIRAVVVDDVHHAEDTGVDIFRNDSLQIGLAVPGVGGYWEIGVSDGEEPQVWVWIAPTGSEGRERDFLPEVARTGNLAIYTLRIPYELIGLTPEIAAGGFGFNIVVNDNDGHGRESWLELAPGIAREKRSDNFRQVVLE